MDRYKLRVRRLRETGFPYKRDTPVKPEQRRRRGNRMLLPKRHYKTLPEEPEEENMNETSVKPVTSERVRPVPNCNSSSLLSNHAFIKNLTNQTASHATPAKEEHIHLNTPQTGHPASQDTPILQSLKYGNSTQSVTSCSMDTTFSSDEDDDSSNCFSSGSATLSSLSSPESFRKENEKSTFGKEELSLYLHNKNSTLLDVSHAKIIQMQHPPNLSAIIDTSTSLKEKKCVTNYQKTEPDSEIQTDSIKSDLQKKTAQKLSVRRPILYKKVQFKSPAIAETFEAKPTPSSTRELSNLSMQVKPEQAAYPSETGEIDKEETLLLLKLKRPVKTSPVKPRFFDFGSDSEKDAYFQWMRKRCDKLKKPVSFPLML